MGPQIAKFIKEPAPATRRNKYYAIKYVGDGHERIFLIAAIGKVGEQLWALQGSKVRLFEKKWVVTIVSVETMDTTTWDEL